MLMCRVGEVCSISNILGAICEKVQNPVAQGGVESKVVQFGLEFVLKSKVYGSCAFSSCSNLQEAGKYTLVSAKCVVKFYLPFFSGSRNGKFPKGAHKVQEFLEVV